MTGFIVNYLGRKVWAGALDSPTSAIAHLLYGNLVFHLQVDTIEGDQYIHSFQMARKGMGVEIEIAEFDSASGAITEDNPYETWQIDPEYIKFAEELASEDSQLQRKLKRFRQLEAILKKEGLI